jgi:hypothetical protein
MPCLLLFTKLDTGVDTSKKTKLLLKRYRQIVLKYPFEGKITDKWSILINLILYRMGRYKIWLQQKKALKYSIKEEYEEPVILYLVYSRKT